MIDSLLNVWLLECTASGGVFLIDSLLNVWLLECTASGGDFLFVSPTGLVGILGFSLRGGFESSPLLSVLEVGADDESESTFSDS